MIFLFYQFHVTSEKIQRRLSLSVLSFNFCPKYEEIEAKVYHLAELNS